MKSTVIPGGSLHPAYNNSSSRHSNSIKKKGHCDENPPKNLASSKNAQRPSSAPFMTSKRDQEKGRTQVIPRPPPVITKSPPRELVAESSPRIVVSPIITTSSSNSTTSSSSNNSTTTRHYMKSFKSSSPPNHFLSPNNSFQSSRRRSSVDRQIALLTSQEMEKLLQTKSLQNDTMNLESSIMNDAGRNNISNGGGGDGDGSLNNMISDDSISNDNSSNGHGSTTMNDDDDREDITNDSDTSSDSESSMTSFHSIQSYLKSKYSKDLTCDMKTLVEFLDRLNLSFMKLKIIPKDIELFKNLIELNLSHNHLRTFNAMLLVDSCPNLVSLDLSYNKIHNILIIRDLCNLKKLLSLNISNNPIRFIDNRIVVLQKMLHFKTTNSNDMKTINESLKTNIMKGSQPLLNSMNHGRSGVGGTSRTSLSIQNSTSTTTANTSRSSSSSCSSSSSSSCSSTNRNESNTTGNHGIVIPMLWRSETCGSSQTTTSTTTIFESNMLNTLSTAATSSNTSRSLNTTTVLSNHSNDYNSTEFTNLNNNTIPTNTTQNTMNTSSSSSNNSSSNNSTSTSILNHHQYNNSQNHFNINNTNNNNTHMILNHNNNNTHILNHNNNNTHMILNHNNNTNSTNNTNNNNNTFMLHTESSIKKDSSLTKTNPIIQSQLVLNKIRKSKALLSSIRKLNEKRNAQELSSSIQQLRMSPRKKILQTVHSHIPIDMSPFVQATKSHPMTSVVSTTITSTIHNNNNHTNNNNRSTLAHTWNSQPKSTQDVMNSLKKIDLKKVRSLDSPFPSLQILNGIPISPEEYLLSLHEEIYDTCASNEVVVVNPIKNNNNNNTIFTTPNTSNTSNTPNTPNTSNTPTNNRSTQQKGQKTLILKDNTKVVKRKLEFDTQNIDFTNNKFSLDATNKLLKRQSDKMKNETQHKADSLYHSINMSYDEFVKHSWVAEDDEFVDPFEEEQEMNKTSRVAQQPSYITKTRTTTMDTLMPKINFSDIIKNEFYQNRKLTDEIMNTKRKRVIDFRPFKEQLLDLTPEQIELKFKRIEMKENISKYRDQILHKVDDKELALTKLKQEYEESIQKNPKQDKLKHLLEGDEISLYVHKKEEQKKHHSKRSSSYSTYDVSDSANGNELTSNKQTKIQDAPFLDNFSLGRRSLEELSMINDHFASASRQENQLSDARKELEELKELKITRKKYSIEGKTCTIDGKTFVFSSLFV